MARAQRDNLVTTRTRDRAAAALASKFCAARPMMTLAPPTEASSGRTSMPTCVWVSGRVGRWVGSRWQRRQNRGSTVGQPSPTGCHKGPSLRAVPWPAASVRTVGGQAGQGGSQAEAEAGQLADGREHALQMLAGTAQARCGHGRCGTGWAWVGQSSGGRCSRLQLRRAAAGHAAGAAVPQTDPCSCSWRATKASSRSFRRMAVQAANTITTSSLVSWRHSKEMWNWIIASCSEDHFRGLSDQLIRHMGWAAGASLERLGVGAPGRTA